ncbi:MAG: MASE3 domain-containing protein [Desulfuromonadaceae bacterium]|nr:MASE3 domain-containing protein [Desulfuromonadaceae bacterium]
MNWKSNPRRQEIMVPGSNRSGQLFYTCVITIITLGFYASSLYSYLLFHGMMEITTISIGFSLFILTWNARKFLANDYLKIIGIGYAFIALIDLLHTLAYKGMNIFPGFDANLPTQLWIAARYLQAVTLCAAPLFVERTIDKRAIFAGYAMVVSLLVAAVYSGNFPDCFVEGSGLTVFKIGSEYVISGLLLASLYLFYRKRNHFNGTVFFLTAYSIACTAVAEISFTAYVSVYGFANMVGHFAKLAAFYLIYRAILVTGLKEPFDLIFRDLKQAEEALQKVNETLAEQVRARTADLSRTNVELVEEVAERIQVEETLHLQAVELEEEVAERQMAQESLEEKALLLEEEIEKRQKAQDELEQLNVNLEQRVRERTAELEEKNRELEHFNKLFVNRELRMVELKERIRELEKKIDR